MRVSPSIHLYFLALSSVIFVLGCHRQDEYLLDLEGVSSLTVKHTPSMAFWDLAWSPNGRSVAARAYEGWANSTVTVIDLETGKTRIVYESGGDYFLGPEWSPDGQSLIFMAPTELVPHSGGVVVVDAQTGQITHDLGFGGYATWTADPERVIVLGFSSSCDKEIPIDEYKLTTGITRTLGVTSSCLSDVADSLDVSSDDKLVLPDATGTNNQILNIADGTELGTLIPLRGSTVWSPDGTMLAFITSSLRNQQHDDQIMLASADGVCLSDPFTAGNELYSLDWSPDGNRLIFSARDRRNRLYFLDLTTGVGKELMNSYREKCDD